MNGMLGSPHKPTRRPSNASITSEAKASSTISSSGIVVEDLQSDKSASRTTSSKGGSKERSKSSNEDNSHDEVEIRKQKANLGYESDETTEVTSNTGPQTQQVPLSATSNDERWNTRDCKNPSRVSNSLGVGRNSTATTRRSSGSMGSSTSSADKIVVAKRVELVPASALSVGIPVNGDDDGVVTVYDLQSKTGYIGFLRQKDQGDFENLQEEDEMLSSSAVSLMNTHRSPLSQEPQLILTKERVRAHLKDYYEDFDSIFRKPSKACWDAFFKQCFTKDILWVRSSSNTIGREDLARMFAHDVVGIRMQLVSIDSIQIMAEGLSAVVVFTADQKFVYRGTPNSDRTVITMVLNVENRREIRIGHEHRCVGKPIPQDTRWD